MKNKVLLVEDEKSLAMIIADTLTGEGFDVAVAFNGEEGLATFQTDGADVLVIDIMMPRMDGFELGRRIRQINPNVPFIYLTALSSLDNIEEGFEIGANDYLKKPFKIRELIIRLKAMLRRYGSRPTNNDDIFPIGKYIYNATLQTLCIDGKDLELSHIEAKILSVLASNIGQTVEASQLMEAVWDRDDIYNRNSLHGFIHKLRRLLSEDPSIAILNQRGIGYKLTVKP